MSATPEVRIGTAGWGVPRDVADRFPPAGSALERYAARFDAVEINSSFHRPHRRSTYERWAASVPQHFRFAVKVPKTVTHEKRLRETDGELDRFFVEIAGLGETLGPLLVQLAPSHAFDAAVVTSFMRTLRARCATPVVCEPRHPTWFEPDADVLLRNLGVARVAADPARVPEAATCGGAADLRYYRLHGSPRVYYASYDAERLAAIRHQLTASSSPAWCIFDNTASGAAAKNALDLIER